MPFHMLKLMAGGWETTSFVTVKLPPIIIAPSIYMQLLARLFHQALFELLFRF